jgi:S-adenosylmethionine:tRNA ribosyltransferase-isomerase
MSELEKFDYPLPRDLVAQEPLKKRSDARLLVVERSTGRLRHHHVRDLPEMLRPGDRMVVNDTLVVPARMLGYRTSTGGRWHGLYLSTESDGAWRILCKTRGKLEIGETITLVAPNLQEDVRLRLLERNEGGVWIVQPESYESATEILARVGRVPLPHYIRGGNMRDADVQAYQTVYAKAPGSVAAPTAGLHFTRELLERIQQAGIGITAVTLHVGMDTFRPIATPTLQAHQMHTERAELSEKAAQELIAAREAGGRIVAVGTTSVRVLESAARDGTIRAFRGATDLFIRPPYEFQAVDALLTNFHLPRTTLLVMICAFAGRDLVMKAYEEAVHEQYRFYSYGDAMLIL